MRIAFFSLFLFICASAYAQSGATRQGLQSFNPEISLLADIAAFLSESEEDAEGNDKISVREIELIFGHDIDPYSRFDSTITLSDFEEVNIEEAYITHWGIPLGIKGRLGRIRPKMGKVSASHRDQLDTADEPLVVQSYLGAEGLFRTGLELSRIFPSVSDSLVHEITAGILEGGIGEGGTLFGGTRRRPSFYAHLKNFWEISDSSSLELGGTYLLGSKDGDARYEVNALGADLTWIYYPTPVNKFKWQSELYWQDRDETEEGLDRHPLGFYSLADFRLSPRFGVGVRGDYVEPIDLAPEAERDADTAVSGYLTFYQSEFSRWRFQYENARLADGINDDRFFLQGTFVIGVHKHQLQ